MQLSNMVDDDIFVSYCRSDATTYTDGIAASLTTRGFSTFTDALGTDACETLPPTLKRKVTSCRMLVLIASPDAARSAAVQTELELFTAARGSSNIVVIDFANSVATAIWKPLVIGLRREIEPVEELSKGNPAAHVLDRIEKAFTYRKLKDRLQRYTKYAIITLAVLVIASIIASIIADRQFNKAHRQQLIANALDLATQSQTLLGQPEQILASVDRAVQSAGIMQQQDLQSSVSDYALRQALAFLPERRQSISHAGKQILFTAGGSLVEIATKDTVGDASAAMRITWFTRPGAHHPFFQVATDPGASFALSKDGNVIAWAVNKDITVVDTRTGQGARKTHTIKGEDKSVKSMTLSPDGRWLAIVIGGDDGDLDRIQLWDRETDRSVDFPQQGVNINSLVFSVNGLVLAAAGMTFDQRGGATGQALLWDFTFDPSQPLDPNNFQPSYRIPQDRELWQIAPGFDNSYFAISTDSIITVWELGSAARHHDICHIPAGTTSFNFQFTDSSRNLHLLRNAHANTDTFDTEEIWNAQGYRWASRYTLPGEIASIAYDPQSKELLAFDNQSPPHLIHPIPATSAASAGGESTNTTFYLSAFAAIKDIPSESGTNFYQTPDLQYFASSSRHIVIARRQQDSFTSAIVDVDLKKGKPDKLTLTPNGQVLAFVQVDERTNTGHCQTLKLSNNHYQPQSSFPVHFPPQSLQLSDDGARAYELTLLDTLRVWDLTSSPARLILTQTDSGGINAMSISPDGQSVCLQELADRDPGNPKFNILLLDTRSNKTTTLLSGIRQHDNWRWTNDGSNLLIAYSGRIQAFSTQDGARTFDESISDAVTTSVMSPSGKYLAFGTAGGTIRILDTKTLTETSRIALSGDMISLAFSDDDRFIYAYASSRTFLDMQPQDNYHIYKCPLQTRDLLDEAKRRLATIIHP